MRILRALQTAVLAVLCTVGTLSVVVCALSFVFDFTPSIVLSGSMEPTLPVGSVVFTQTVDVADVAVGDIVTVPQHGDEGIVTHRVVAIEPADAGRAKLTLRGDANQVDDIAPYTVRTADLYRFKIPYIGTGILWAKDHRLTAGVILLGLLIFTFFGRSRLTVRLPNGEVVKGLSKKDAERLVAAWQADSSPSPDSDSIPAPDSFPSPDLVSSTDLIRGEDPIPTRPDDPFLNRLRGHDWIGGHDVLRSDDRPAKPRRAWIDDDDDAYPVVPLRPAVYSTPSLLFEAKA
jgi:signal peptidase